MKKTLFIIILLVYSISTWAQDHVTRFLDIPVDGTKEEMIEKLKAKGFTETDSVKEYLFGYFNETKVKVLVHAYNNKVYRISVHYIYYQNEIKGKLQFNNLIKAFTGTGKYLPFRTSEPNFKIPTNDTYRKDTYWAAFLQLPPELSLDKVQAKSDSLIQSISAKAQNTNMIIQEEEDIKNFVMQEVTAPFQNQIVSVVLSKSKQEPEYYNITFFYDNMYNAPTDQNLLNLLPRLSPVADTSSKSQDTTDDTPGPKDDTTHQTSIPQQSSQTESKDIIHFLGIPVDGKKTEVLAKLKTKGFSSIMDNQAKVDELIANGIFREINDTSLLFGKFNNEDVILNILIHEDKVCNISLLYEHPYDEAAIKAKFIKLCRQLLASEKYIPAYHPDLESFEQEKLTVNQEQYTATFFELPQGITKNMVIMEVRAAQQASFQKAQSLQASITKQKEMIKEATINVLKKYEKKRLWFFIESGQKETAYHLIINYDNVYNLPAGEDL